MFDLLASVISATENSVKAQETAAPVASPQPAPESLTWTSVETSIEDDPPVANVAPPVDVLPQLPPVPELPKLEISTRRGDFVHNTQVMDDSFRNVSAAWSRKCMTYDQAREKLAKERGDVRDLKAPLRRFSPIAGSRRIMLNDSDDGRNYVLSDRAAGQLYAMLGIGTTLPATLLRGGNDSGDVATLQAVLDNGWRNIDQDKRGLIRLRNDGTVRALLSESYAILDNEWFLDVVQETIPGALVSHFAGDGDSVYFNALIPDSIRAESDSEYGGMLACGNSEIGVRKLSTSPAVFRAICRNGCIWDRADGIAIRKVHRGDIDRAELADKIRRNLTAQIPLLDDGISRMLRLREHETQSPVACVLSAVIAETRVQVARVDADRMLLAHAIEVTQPGATSAFDIVQSITRAAQEFAPSVRDSAERMAGESLLWTGADWSRVFANSGAIDQAELKRTYTKAGLQSAGLSV